MPRLGVRLETGPNLSPGEMVELASLAEQRGYETLWLPEGSGDATMLLAAFATATRRIGLATGILPIFHRTPTLTAMAAGGLDALSGGRFVLGLGVGHQGAVEGGQGVPFRRPLTRLRETVEIVRRLLRGERVTYSGKIFSLRDHGLGFSLVRQDTPIYLAALGPQMIELAGEVADGVLLNWASPSYLPLAIDHLRTGARRAGRDPDGIDVACYMRTAVVADPEAAGPSTRRQIARYFSMPFYRNYFAQIGFGEEATAVSRALDRGDAEAAASAISDSMQAELAIVGTPEHCRREIEDRRAMGLKQPIIAPFTVGDDTGKSFRDTISAFSG